MVSINSLNKCYDIVSRLDNVSPLWIPGWGDAGKLSFVSGKYDSQQWLNEKDKSGVIYQLISTHENFEEYIECVKNRYSKFVTDSDVNFCNEIIARVFSDKYIDKSFEIGGVTVLRKIEPLRFVRFMCFKKLISNLKSSRSFTYWQEINDFTDMEYLLFNGRPYKFHKRFLNVLCGYVSGDIRNAYADGGSVLDRYEALLTEICELENSPVFKYVSNYRLGVTNGDGMRLTYLVNRIHEAKEGIISTRNDGFLNERAFVIELLKLFHEYGCSNPTSAIYRFTRSSLLENDIERKTIQRCWESLKERGQRLMFLS